MGSCCCKDDSPYFRFEGQTIMRNKRKKALNDIYKKYSKKKCFICDRIKYGKTQKVVYGYEFMCIDCGIESDKKDRRLY